MIVKKKILITIIIIMIVLATLIFIRPNKTSFFNNKMIDFTTTNYQVKTINANQEKNMALLIVDKYTTF